jgi:hypothetical protein
MAESKTKYVTSPLKTKRQTFAAPFKPADYDAAVFTSVQGLTPTVDAMYSSMMVISANVWAIQRRMKIMEALMEKHGKVTAQMIEQYQPTATEKQQWANDRNALVAEIYDPFKMVGTIDYNTSIDVPDPTVKKAL